MQNALKYLAVIVVAIALFNGASYYLHSTWEATGYIVPNDCGSEECYLRGKLSNAPEEGLIQITTDNGITYKMAQAEYRLMVIEPKHR